jgi:hypothetical protein
VVIAVSGESARQLASGVPSPVVVPDADGSEAGGFGAGGAPLENEYCPASALSTMSM